MLKIGIVFSANLIWNYLLHTPARFLKPGRCCRLNYYSTPMAASGANYYFDEFNKDVQNDALKGNLIYTESSVGSAYQ
ncbi:MAG: hypothetical protein ABI325_07585 [Ginsengibacter sp.]